MPRLLRWAAPRFAPHPDRSRTGNNSVALTYKAAVLHAPKTPLTIETVQAAELAPDDVLVRIKAAGLCHTDLEVIDGSLRNPMPIVLGHEAAGVVEAVGAAGTRPRQGGQGGRSW